jgi:hypothetical protein
MSSLTKYAEMDVDDIISYHDVVTGERTPATSAKAKIAYEHTKVAARRERKARLSNGQHSDLLHHKRLMMHAGPERL